jgi:hypothetical protein
VNRAAILGAVLAVAGVLGGCGHEAATHATATPEPGTTAGGPVSVIPTTPAGPSTRSIAVTVRDGQVSGDTGRVEVAPGTPIMLSVTSDVADEIHLHGYDKEVQIPAGGTGSISFTADIPGVFEVELHESGLSLFQLQVG